MNAFFILTGIFACQPEVFQEVVLPDDRYSYTCIDRQEFSTIEMTAQYCNEDINSLRTEVSFNEGYSKVFNLTETYDCLWEADFEMIEEICIQVIDVEVIGGINEAG